jgi:riboflavin kinase/FMN adenylyltransferase
MSNAVNIEDYTSRKPTVVTIGTFDGVHVGHQKIVKRLVDHACKENLKSVILTFFPHPRMVLQKDSGIKLINTIRERSQILDRIGLDYLLIKKFTKAFSRLTAEEFVKDILVDKLNAKKVIIGYDHRFGRNRNADINDLKAFGDSHGFEVEEISVEDVDKVAVSSTKIRQALQEGAVETANAYLGYEFMLSGKVVEGKGLGRQIGYRTANIAIPEDYKIVPKYGAYIVASKLEGKTVYGMMNIGVNPTVDGKKESIEVHFFDFNASIYNQDIQVNVLKRIRDERKFETLEALKAQLQKDKIFSTQFIKAHHAQ